MTPIKLSPKQEQVLRYVAASVADRRANDLKISRYYGSVRVLAGHGLMAPNSLAPESLTEAGRAWLAANSTPQLAPVSEPDTKTLMAAIARMAERMASSAQAAGSTSSNGGDWRRHLDNCSRQRRAMHRLMDALARGHGEDHSDWRWTHTFAVIDDHKRAIAKGA